MDGNPGACQWGGKQEKAQALAIESWEQSTAFPAAGLVYAAEK